MPDQYLFFSFKHKQNTLWESVFSLLFQLLVDDFFKRLYRPDLLKLLGLPHFFKATDQRGDVVAKESR